MSLTPVFAPDAKSQWLELDLELQELFLDELEKVIADSPRAAGKSFIRDFVVQRAGERHYVFFEITIDWRNDVMTVTGIHSYTRG